MIRTINISELRGQRVALLLSGGVDSAVALHLAVEAGLNPDCFYIKIGPEEDSEWDCSSEEDLEMCHALVRRYGCAFEVVDCHRDYWDQVTRYTMDKVRTGLTPNPDVMCNRLVKFGAFDRKRGHDYDVILTGHYACKAIDDEGRHWLATSPDPVKDQTDFLAQIEGWQLQKAFFPIGGMQKETVRRIAEEHRLINAKRKDSQGICFLGRIDYNEYIRRYLGEQPGDIVEQETGRVIGQHRGLWFHTIGQRKGLGLGGGPWFVISKDIAGNRLMVSHGYDPESVYVSRFGIRAFNFLTPGIGELPQRVLIKIRHTPEFHRATLVCTADGCYFVETAAPLHGVAPGQFCVVYSEDTISPDSRICYGSGEIYLL